MTHLTLTGLYAGRPLCDGDRLAQIEAGDRHMHVAYASDAQIAAPEVCPACQAEWYAFLAAEAADPAPFCPACEGPLVNDYCAACRR